MIKWKGGRRAGGGSERTGRNWHRDPRCSRTPGPASVPRPGSRLNPAPAASASGAFGASQSPRCSQREWPAPRILSRSQSPTSRDCSRDPSAQGRSRKRASWRSWAGFAGSGKARKGDSCSAPKRQESGSPHGAPVSDMCWVPAVDPHPLFCSPETPNTLQTQDLMKVCSQVVWPETLTRADFYFSH